MFKRNVVWDEPRVHIGSCIEPYQYHKPSDRHTNAEHLEHVKEDLTKAPFQLLQLMPAVVETMHHFPTIYMALNFK